MEMGLSDRILQYLSGTDSVSSLDLAAEFNEDHQKIVGAMKSLECYGKIISTEHHSKTQLMLTEEGKCVLNNGSHEARIFENIPVGKKMLLDDLAKCFIGVTDAENIVKIGLNKALQARWIKITTDNGKSMVTRLVPCISDPTRLKLRIVSAGSNLDQLTKDDVEELRRRNLIVSLKINFFTIRRGTEYSNSVLKQETELSEELLNNQEYKKRSFKPYNFDSMGPVLRGGHLHPLQKVRAEFLTILTEMGFSEMPTNRFVESSFWNFDSLFVPQEHPARDVQDTFFLSRPKNCNRLPEDYKERVKRVHSVGGFGSVGYGTEWKEERARQNVLRTHTTAISARVLYELAQQEEFKPVKKFSIDRVFRNETLDATHLAEFHQVEGFVADRNLSLGHLIGVMTEFFRRLGIDQLRFKPAYNPYTEPSMEVFAFHKGLKKWVEVGNSGVFRPEMLLPMGLPEDVTVIAWGLSLERPTMIRYGIDNIRTLVGPRVDLKMVYNNPLCRLDKQ